MAGNLLRKLAALSANQPAPVKAKETHLLIKEHFESVDDSVYHLERNALLDMGYTGNDLDIEKALFIDTETTGLSGGAGTVAFLVGIGYIEKGRITVRQYVIPDYSCEAEMLGELADIFERFDSVVHFNGTRFDIPLLRERFTMKRLSDRWKDLYELDLLPPARKVWKLRLGCCRLKYLEETVLGMPRSDDDIPGSEIPARYFECVRTGKLELLDDIIDHNRQDILTLVKLLTVLNGIYAKPEAVTEKLDTYSLGRTFEKLGNKSRAKKLYTLAAVPCSVHTVHDLRNDKYAGEANQRLYCMYRRSAEYDKCEDVLKCMIRRKQKGEYPYVELAKLYEHKFKRYRDALSLTEWLISEYGGEEYLKRKHRLESKINTYGG